MIQKTETAHLSHQLTAKEAGLEQITKPDQNALTAAAEVIVRGWPHNSQNLFLSFQLPALPTQGAWTGARTGRVPAALTLGTSTDS